MERPSSLKKATKAKATQQCVFLVGLFIGRLKRKIKKSKHRRYVLDEWLTTE